jgi:MurNAc alpha-1-phosphate uridylyltransferase
MLLAAGRGERMRPLTDTCPKPLLRVQGQSLLHYPLQALARAGVSAVVINTGWLGDQIEPAFGAHLTPPLVAGGDASKQMQLLYSHEGRGAGEALETAGGIVRALPLLDDVFWVAAGDVFVPEFEFQAQRVEQFSASGHLAHIWLVPNPPHNPLGDFGLSQQGRALNLPKNQTEQALYTFSTIALYRRTFFEMPYCDIVPGNPQGTAAPLAPLLRAAMDRGQVGASLYTGPWTDVGTPERLAQLNA